MGAAAVSRALLVIVVGLACLVLLAEAYPQPQIQSRDGYGKPVSGRVKIQTYRGPSKGYGYDKFAPWGYYVTQPEDEKVYGYH